MAGNRVTETDVAMAVIRILVKMPNGEASIAKLIEEVPDYLALSEADRKQSTTRPGEEMWEQQVRNITSHHASPGNFIHEGYLEAIEGGLRITEAALSHLT